MKNFSRKQFIQTAAGAALAMASRVFTTPLHAADNFFREPPWKRKKPYWGFAVDVTKCIGCGRCADACKTENEVPREAFYFRTWVERYIFRRSGEINVDSPNGGIDGYPQPQDPETITKSFFVPKMCNHCENSPCDQVCPVGATFKTEDGVVLVDRKYCIGCRYCIQACPYGCRYFHPVLHVADKCTLCYHRIKKGLKTACVEVCPTGARMFGDLSDPKSAITKFRESEAIQTLKAHMGTEPKLVYKGLDKEVR